MMLYGKKYGGANPQLIEGDSFRMIIRVPEFSENPALSPQIRTRTETGALLGVRPKQVGEQVAKVLTACKRQSRTKAELLEILGLANVYMNYKRHLLPLIEQSFIEMTIPDKPKSRLQKYRLTVKGEKLIKGGSL